MYINAHDHLDQYQDLAQSLDIIERNSIISLAVSMDEKDFRKIEKIAQDHPLIKKGLGIHPWRVLEETNLRDLEPLVPQADFLGEIGLDYFWAPDSSLYPKQREIFEGLLVLAKDHKKVCNIHTKGAEDHVLSYLKKHKMRGQIIHWYSGPLDLVKDYLALDSYFTIGPDIGYSQTTDQLIDLLPLDRILTETDGPKSLEWVNGQYGQPTYIRDILHYIGKRKNLDLLQLKEEVYGNYLSLDI